MIETIKNKSSEIMNPREDHNSTTGKSSNENTPNIPKKYTCMNDKKTINKLPSKNNINQFGEFPTDFKAINNKPKKDNIVIDENNFTEKNKNAQSNKKDFIEKKRRRRNKCSYSNKRNKKSKKRNNFQQLSQSLTNIILIKDLNSQKITQNKTCNINLEEENNKENEKIIQKVEKAKNESNQNNKKKIKIDEKELIANREKEFMDNLNKQYSDEQYNKDLEMNLKEKRAQFMKENFPIMFRKDKYYLYTVLLKKRRTQPINFIQPKALFQDIKESQKHQTLYLNEEPEFSEHVFSENSDEDKMQPIKNKNISTKKNFTKNEKSKIKINCINFMDSEIISSINQKNDNDHNNCKKEVEQIKRDLTIPRQQIQEKNKKKGSGLSETSPSEHDVKNLDINLIDDIDEQNKDNKNNLKIKKEYTLLPKHIWSFPEDKNDLDIEMFYDNCIQIWPFNECIFVKEIALEFLMKNNYSTTVCLNRLNDFVSFMKKRAEELNMSIINKNEKTVKKYSLRNTKFN